MSPSPLYRLQDGRYLLLFYNNDGTANGGKSPIDSKHNRYPVWLTVGREIPGEQRASAAIWTAQDIRHLQWRNGALVPGAHRWRFTRAWLMTATTRILFYPDRKHYLLGKYITGRLAARL